MKTSNSPDPESPEVQGVSGLSTVNATTDFFDDGQVAKRDESAVLSRDEIYNTINDSQESMQTIINYLNKPIVIANGNFSIADTYNFLNSYSMPYSALVGGQGDMYLNKLRGYYGISMDMRFRLVINANRFQMGRYCIGWVPLCAPASTTSQLKNLLFNNQHMATLMQRTTVPHVEIDLATGTSAELLVPFTSPGNFYSLNEPLSATDEHPLGFINVYPYYPLVAPAGSTVASYTLYVSFENVRLFGAASPQSGISDKELSNKNNGPISSVAMAFSRGFKEFAQIPLLSSYAKNISWVMGRTANVASMFGFDKPIQGDSLTKMMILNTPSHTNVDGDSDVRTLSLLQKPGTVQVDGLFGTEYDEMDFSYICRKYAWFRTIAWNTSDSIGNIAQIGVYPVVGAATVAGSLNVTPLAFNSFLFQNWRGSMKFKFKLVKTEFHSGRLSFAFFPSDALATYTGEPYYVNRVIVDIRDTTEVELVIPYISRTAWQYIGDKIGVVAIDIVDPLVAPATVSTYVQILTEVAGGDDFELAIPTIWNYSPTSITPQSGVNHFDSCSVSTTEIFPQSGIVDTSMLSTTIGASVVNASPNVASSACIGDKVSNFRAYLKRYSKTTYSGTVATNHALNLKNLWLPTDYIMCTSAAAALPATYWNSDMYGVVASCYGMVKGGVRIRDILDYGVLSAGSSDTGINLWPKAPTIVSYSPLPTGQSANPIVNSNATVSTLSPNLSSVIQDVSNNFTVSVEVPQYTNGYARSVVDMITYQDTAYNGYQNGSQSTTTRGRIGIHTPSLISSNLNGGLPSGYTLHNIYRSAAEDTSFGVFISVPPMVLNSSVIDNGGFF